MRHSASFSSTTALSAVIVCGSLTISCTKQIPPPPAPARSLPATTSVEEDALDVQQTRNTSMVSISSDVPAKVERMSGVQITPMRWGVRTRRSWETICASTPCSVRLPQGESVLHFVGITDSARESMTTINVGSERAAINHTLGQERGSVGTYVGVGLIIVGLAALIFPYGFDLDQPKAAPAVFVAGGIGSIFGGLTLMGLDPAIKQPGATTAWTPSKEAPQSQQQQQQQQQQQPPPQVEPTTRPSFPAVRGVGLGFAF